MNIIFWTWELRQPSPISSRSRRLVPLLSIIAVLTFSYESAYCQAPAAQEAPSTQSATEVETAGTESKSNQPPADETEEPLPDNLRPYRVLVSAVFQPHPGMTVSLRANILKGFADVAERTVGQMWSLDIEENRWLLPASSAGIDRLSSEDLLERYGDSDYDKVFLLLLTHSGAQYQLQAREWDASTQQLDETGHVDTYHRRRLAVAAFTLVQRLFHPVLNIDRIGESEIGLILRAGDFPAVDPDLVQVREGDLIAPFFRYLDREQVVQKIHSVPWTYLLVTSVNRGRVRCRAISGLRSPLGSRRRRRVQTMGLCLKPRYESTEVQLLPRNNPTRPLAAHHIRVVTKTFAKDESSEESRHVYTDRRGKIRLDRNSQHPIVWLYVHSGSALLARVPFAPGMHRLDALTLQDDTFRLAVEGEVALVKSRLIDTVARRTTLLSRAQRHAAQGQREQTDERLDELATLPGKEEFEQQLAAIRVEWVREAKAARANLAARKIEKLCNDAKRLVGRFIDEDKTREIIEQILALRDDPPAEQP